MLLNGKTPKSVCVSKSICKLVTEKDDAKVGLEQYTITKDGCMALAKPVIPFIKYDAPLKNGTFGATCRAATDCTSTAKNHGCLIVSNEKEKTSICVDNCSIGSGSKVIVGDKEWIARTTTCLLPVAPEVTKESIGTVKLEGQCRNTEQCL